MNSSQLFPVSGQSIEQPNQRILDKYNGRVNLMEPEDPMVRFQMFERIAIKNKASEYRNPLDGIWEENLLSKTFFSVENVQILQNGMRAGVYRLSKDQYVIPPQNLEALKIVMRSIYLQHAKHSQAPIREQVATLNQLVLEYCVPYVYNECVAYIKYLQDQSTLVVPLDREVRPDREYKQLEMKPFF
jgi:hypothetical protein